MSAEPSLDWAKLLSAVRAEHPMLYRSWFDSLEPGELNGGELRVVVPDPVWAHYLREHCAHAFADCAMGLSGRLVSVEFVTPRDGRSPTRTDERWGALTELPLNADYTFDEFVVGPSNRLAHAACRAVCDQPGVLYNPLFIHGASGLGKTHLLQATCAELARLKPGAHVVYVSCETFVNDFIRAIETGRLRGFRECTRGTYALVIDDVQFLAKRESSQEELFHTFNVLYQSHRQMILSADSPPAEIPTLEDRLVSRFKWGLVAQIDPPNREMRQAILQKKARLRGCEVPPDVLDYIAEHVESNIRALEGALTRLLTECQVGRRPLNLQTAQELLGDSGSRPIQPPQVSDILSVVSRHFGIRLQELLGRRRTRSISYPRQIAMYLIRRLTPLSLEEIGMHFDGRDHSTILHAERAIEAERRQNLRVAETLSLLVRQLRDMKAR